MTFTADILERYLQIAVAVMAVIAVAALAALIVRRKKIVGRSSAVRNVLYGILSSVLVGGIVGSNVASNIYAGSINAAMTKAAQPDTTITSTMDDWKGLVTDIADEGMVLMLNENETLPLETGTKINLLGYSAYNPFFSGSGSGSVSAADAVSVVTALTDAGYELNPALLGAPAWPEKPADTNPFGYNEGDLFFGDVPIDNYSGDISFEKQKEFSDTAVVVLGRAGGEGYDLTSLEGVDYLQLTEEEKDLLSAAQENFETVIVLLNMVNTLSMKELLEYDIDAMVWCGVPGPYGFESVGRIMNGTVNPSGSLPDTWVMDNDCVPALENYGEQKASNADSFYVDYAEGIYVGYKWFETAYAEKAEITSVRTGKTFDYKDYDSIVAFPFGYGLSYTTFEQTIESAPEEMDPQGSMTFEVKVTNTGSVAGRDAVQLYVSVPYTDYDKDNGVEKAAVSLCGFGKTGMIEPGESETVAVEVKAEDIASYDEGYANEDGTSGSYMLDAGEYTFIAGDNAHVPYADTKVTLAEDYFYSGSQKREADVVAASNAFDDAARGEYLSRKDAFANYEAAMTSPTDVLKSTDWEDNTNQYDPAYDEAVAKTYVKGTDYAAKGSLTLADMAGLSFDDEKWDQLISQLTLEEMQALVSDSLYKTPAVPSVRLGGIGDSDGPLGISNFFNPSMNSVAYPGVPILSATFNTDLAVAFGESVSDQAHNKGLSGWYAPAMDTHRTPYSGRNFEYYSEDGWLGAAFGSAATLGARNKGMIVYIKHFALNDQETHRSGNLHTYSNEQAIREIYLKPFEYSVKLGGANGIMTSMNYIGDTYVGGHEGLLQNVLRGEWGFRGKSLTDMDESGESANVDKCMRAGTDAWLSITPFGMKDKGSLTDADIYYLQRSAKNILYPIANSRIYESIIVNWRGYLNILCAAMALLTAVLIAALVIRNKKK